MCTRKCIDRNKYDKPSEDFFHAEKSTANGSYFLLLHTTHAHTMLRDEFALSVRSCTWAELPLNKGRIVREYG